MSEQLNNNYAHKRRSKVIYTKRYVFIIMALIFINLLLMTVLTSTSYFGTNDNSAWTLFAVIVGVIFSTAFLIVSVLTYLNYRSINCEKIILLSYQNGKVVAFERYIPSNLINKTKQLFEGVDGRVYLEGVTLYIDYKRKKRRVDRYHVFSTDELILENNCGLFKKVNNKVSQIISEEFTRTVYKKLYIVKEETGKIQTGEKVDKKMIIQVY